MKKTLYIFIFCVLLILFVAGYAYIYQNHRDITSEKVVFSVTPAEIIKEFSANETIANKKYLDKTILVAGKISAIDSKGNALVIDDKVFASFEKKMPATLTIASDVKIKGRFIGYDNLLEELKMDQCSIDKE